MHPLPRTVWCFSVTIYGDRTFPSKPNCASTMPALHIANLLIRCGDLGYDHEHWKDDWCFDNWCLRRILNVHWSEHVPNLEIRLRTQQPPLSDAVWARCRCFFGHMSRADSSQDHRCALQGSIFGLPQDWKRRLGHPRLTWLMAMYHWERHFTI